MNDIKYSVINYYFSNNPCAKQHINASRCPCPLSLAIDTPVSYIFHLTKTNNYVRYLILIIVLCFARENTSDVFDYDSETELNISVGSLPPFQSYNIAIS